MANWREIIICGSDAELNKLSVDSSLTASGLIYPAADGTNEQVLQTDGSGNLSFTDKDSGPKGDKGQKRSGRDLARAQEVQVLRRKPAGQGFP